jgi:hypothetical protein
VARTPLHSIQRLLEQFHWQSSCEFCDRTTPLRPSWRINRSTVQRARVCVLPEAIARPCVLRRLGSSPPIFAESILAARHPAVGAWNARRIAASCLVFLVSRRGNRQKLADRLDPYYSRRASMKANITCRGGRVPPRRNTPMPCVRSHWLDAARRLSARVLQAHLFGRCHNLRRLVLRIQLFSICAVQPIFVQSNGFPPSVIRTRARDHKPSARSCPAKWCTSRDSRSIGLVLSSPLRRAERVDCRRESITHQGAGSVAAIATRHFAPAAARPPGAL